MISELAVLGLVLLGVASNFSAYRNGVNDGYKAASDWGNPGYFKAIRILKSIGIWEQPTVLSRRILDTWVRKNKDRFSDFD